jgi:hypothetical protein
MEVRYMFMELYTIISRRKLDDLVMVTEDMQKALDKYYGGGDWILIVWKFGEQMGMLVDGEFVRSDIAAEKNIETKLEKQLMVGVLECKQ